MQLAGYLGMPTFAYTTLRKISVPFTDGVPAGTWGTFQAGWDLFRPPAQAGNMLEAYRLADGTLVFEYPQLVHVPNGAMPNVHTALFHADGSAVDGTTLDPRTLGGAVQVIDVPAGFTEQVTGTAQWRVGPFEEVLPLRNGRSGKPYQLAALRRFGFAAGTAQLDTEVETATPVVAQAA